MLAQDVSPGTTPVNTTSPGGATDPFGNCNLPPAPGLAIHPPSNPPLTRWANIHRASGAGPYRVLPFIQQNRRPSSQSQRLRRAPLVHSNLQIAVRSNVSDRLAVSAMGKRRHQFAHRMAAYLQIDNALFDRAGWQIVFPEIRNQVAEGIHLKHHALQKPVRFLRARQRKSLEVRYLFA